MRIESRALLALQGVTHGFFTSEGGVSIGLYASLNCGQGSRDDPEAVAENRRRVGAALGVAGPHLLSANQIHSATAILVDAPWPPDDRPKVDGLVTRTPGLALGVLTADCAPVLFCDPIAGVIGAAHSGWRGALGGILESTLAVMEQAGARRANTSAVVGPCISQQNYEVGPELREPFLQQDRANARYFGDGAESRWGFDLAGYVAARLEAANVGSVETLGLCTYADAARFYSYRRSCHRGEPDYGRQISAIALQ